jgi:tRNA (guanosine-2'-O-)-methyltransferase
MGFRVFEHRAVPDDRAAIAAALRDLMNRVDCLFVTGGLGPTSDDFTREVIAKVLSLPLEFDETSWQRIVERFAARGAVARPIQRQQCYFPRSAKILLNSAGTANAFQIQCVLPAAANGSASGSELNRECRLYVLPGPPIEIEAVWRDQLDADLAAFLDKRTPVEDREQLLLLRTLGPGESVIAEQVEELIAQFDATAVRESRLNVGYRANLPYVEVKLWFKERERHHIQKLFDQIKSALEPSLVDVIADRSEVDVLDRVFELFRDVSDQGLKIHVIDEISSGYCQTRLQEKWKNQNSLRVTTVFAAQPMRGALATVDAPAGETSDLVIRLTSQQERSIWQMQVNGSDLFRAQFMLEDQIITIEPTPLYGFTLERSRKYATEMAFQALARLAREKRTTSTPGVEAAAKQISDAERKRFPHSGRFDVEGKSLTAREVLKVLEGQLTAERIKRIREVVDRRTCEVVPVLENIYDRGNISAVLRTAEALGFQCAHVIELNEKFKSSMRVTKGADKWLDVTRWKSTAECVHALRDQGFQILVTHLDHRAKPIGEIDMTVPTAIVFGNEKEGVSREMIEAADHTVIVPMQGFVQSFNISVAGALSLYHIHREREMYRGFSQWSELTDEQKEILCAEFAWRSSKNAEALIERLGETP